MVILGFNPRARGGRDLCEQHICRITQTFQSTRPRGARRVTAPPRLPASAKFQSTRPRGARPGQRQDLVREVVVSIHAPAGGATCDCGQLCAIRRVSIHAPAGGATRRSRRARLRSSCFNPRARGGRDRVPQQARTRRIVSIHAPAGGATIGQAGDVRRCGAFQSTRPRGARRGVEPWVRPIRSVSIHAPAGGATRSHGGGVCLRAVSIHAPAGGATGAGQADCCSGHRFNPRARGGRDMPLVITSGSVRRFQSTRPRGARPRPRLRSGEVPSVSIHAPAGGATHGESMQLTVGNGFNPRARGGRDSLLNWRPAASPCFNPRARGGRDPGRSRTIPRGWRFNPRARGGRDQPECLPLQS